MIVASRYIERDGDEHKFLLEQIELTERHNKDVKEVLDFTMRLLAQTTAVTAKLAYKSGMPAGIEDSNQGYFKVYVELPSGQVMWEFESKYIEFFSFLPVYDNYYDGHTEEQLLERLNNPGF